MNRLARVRVCKGLFRILQGRAFWQEQAEAPCAPLAAAALISKAAHLGLWPFATHWRAKGPTADPPPSRKSQPPPPPPPCALHLQGKWKWGMRVNVTGRNE